MPTNFYDLLEIPEDASQEEVKAAWREKAREYHPDVNDDARAGAQFKTLRTAYDVLSDRTERRAYDRLGHEEYVSTRLDGLPTGGMSRASSRWNRGTADGDAGGSGTSDRASGSGSGGDTGGATGTSTGRSSTSQRSTGRRSTDAGTRASGSTDRGSTGDGRDRGQSTTDRSSASGRRSAGATSSSNRTNRSASARTGSSGGTSAGTSVGGSGARGRNRSTGTAAGPATGTRSETGSARSPLWYGWLAVLTAAVAYAAALGAFATSNADTVRALAASLVAAPVRTLLDPSGLAVSQFAARAVADPGVELLFVTGVVVLPAVLAVTVGRFGSGSAWLYPLAALAPGVAVLGDAALPAVAALDLALLVVLPVASAVGFLVDVGRFLFGGS